MQIYILYNDFDYAIERASCDSQKLQEIAKAYNGEEDLGPYYVIPIELEDVLQSGVEVDEESRCPECGETEPVLCCENCGHNWSRTA